jgi:hypothetical protein
MRRRSCSIVFVPFLVLVLQVSAQQSQKPLTNADVTKMAKSGLPESTIVGAIQANDTTFDVSADRLIELQRSGVPQAVINAMLAATANRRGQSGAPRSSTASGPGSSSVAPGLPSATLLQDGSKANIAAEKTQLAQTNAKASSLGSLASDSVLNHAFRSGVNVAAWQAWEHSGMLASYGLQEGGGVVSALMSKRRSTVTYVWALPAPNSSTSVQSNTPAFEVNFADVPGIIAEDYEPAIVKLTRTLNNWRLVGATQGNADAMAGTYMDWQMYSSFVEDRVPAQTKKTATGQVHISPARPLAPGEYGVVLRPFSKFAKFSGGDVARNQGAGLLFNTVWSFTVK